MKGDTDEWLRNGGLVRMAERERAREQRLAAKWNAWHRFCDRCFRWMVLAACLPIGLFLVSLFLRPVRLLAKHAVYGLLHGAELLRMIGQDNVPSVAMACMIAGAVLYCVGNSRVFDNGHVFKPGVKSVARDIANLGLAALVVALLAAAEIVMLLIAG